MLDFSLPIRIRKNKKDYFVKEILFNNNKYALVKIDIEKTNEHDDIAIIALSSNELDIYGYRNEVDEVTSGFLKNCNAINGFKKEDKDILKNHFNIIINSKKIDHENKSKFIKAIFNEIGCPDVEVYDIPDGDNKSKMLIGKRIGHYYYAYDYSNIEEYVKFINNFTEKYHDLLLLIYNVMVGALNVKKPYNSPYIYFNLNKESKQIEIKDFSNNCYILLEKEMNIEQKELINKFPIVEDIDDFDYFQELLLKLNKELNF